MKSFKFSVFSFQREKLEPLPSAWKGRPAGDSQPYQWSNKYDENDLVEL